MNLFEVSREINQRLGRIFLRDEQGARPVHPEAYWDREWTLQQPGFD
jgi:hypothetical protein